VFVLPDEWLKVNTMEIKPIRTETDDHQDLARLELIFDAKFGSPEGDELEVSGILIDQYENEHFCLF
jgi:HTH-type transcriptional regulator/antitoxin HigA